MTQSKRASKKAPRTAIVPRIVFQTAIAVSVIPVAGGAVAGCVTHGVAVQRDARFSVADVLGVAADGGLFSVAMPQPDANMDATFSVADVGFSVADVGFSVAAPLDAPQPDGGFFSVAIEAPDAGDDTGARG